MLTDNSHQQLPPSPCSAKKAKADDIHGADSDWERAAKKREGRDKAKVAKPNNDLPATGDDDG